MKKIYILITILVSVFVLTSCTTTETEENFSLIYDRLDQEWVSRDEMKTLRVAMDLKYPPFETVDEMNTPEGISVDIAYAFGEFIGRDVEIVNTSFGAIIPALESGEVDIAIASMSYTEARDEKVDFSDYYFYFKIITLVNKSWAKSNGITENSSIDDLATSGGSFTGIASQVSVSIPESYGLEVLEAADLATATENVVQGTADVLLMSANPVVQAYKANPEETMVVWSSWKSSPIAMAVQEGNSELQELANEFIATFKSKPEGGGFYDFLKTRWDAVILENLGSYGLDFYINED
jgi:polar amino acid transport system substrate-binding protein